MLVVDGEVIDDTNLEPEGSSNAIKELEGGKEPFCPGSSAADAIVISVTQEPVELRLRVRRRLNRIDS
jgi:hypothetical protein